MYNEKSSKELADLIANVRAIQIWFHSAHLLSKGEAFESDHKIYKEIYEIAESDFDSYSERAIGLMEDESIASPKTISKCVCDKIKFWIDPANSNALLIAAAGLNIVKDHIQKIEIAYNQIKQSGSMTLGLDDLLMSTASNWETIVYKLQQRIKFKLN